MPIYQFIHGALAQPCHIMWRNLTWIHAARCCLSSLYTHTQLTVCVAACGVGSGPCNCVCAGMWGSCRDAGLHVLCATHCWETCPTGSRRHISARQWCKQRGSKLALVWSRLPRLHDGHHAMLWIGRSRSACRLCGCQSSSVPIICPCDVDAVRRVSPCNTQHRWMGVC